MAKAVAANGSPEDNSPIGRLREIESRLRARNKVAGTERSVYFIELTPDEYKRLFKGVIRRRSW